MSLVQNVFKESENVCKASASQYTQEYKLEALWQVKAGQSIAGVAKVLGIPKASLGNCVRQDVKGALSGAGEKTVSVRPEQMELARLRAENARLRMERDIAKSGGVLRAGHAAGYAWIHQMRKH